MKILTAMFVSVALFVAQGASPTTGASDSPTIIPGDPSLCTTDPRPRSFFEPYLGTPGAFTAPDTRIVGTPIPVATPQGEQVDADTHNSVAALLTQYNSCATAGKPASVSALMTDSAALMFTQSLGADFVSAEHPESHVTDLVLQSAIELPDGSVVAIVTSENADTPSERSVTQAFHLVQEDSTWKIDDIRVLGVATPESSQS